MEKRRSDVTEDELLFDAVLYPHRSLNSLGFRLLMLGVILISFLVGGLFFAVGAWPVIGFLGLDVLLIYLAFQISYRSATLFERIKLSRKELLYWPNIRSRSPVSTPMAANPYANTSLSS